MEKVLFLTKLWYPICGAAKQENLISNKLIPGRVQRKNDHGSGI